VARVCLNAEQRLGRLEGGQLEASDWRYWERVINQFGIVIDRSRGQAHPLYADMTYPIDYAQIPGMTGADGQDLDAFVGSAQTSLVGVIALIHQPGRNRWSEAAGRRHVQRGADELGIH
jgi:hypothetical protein